MFNEQRPDIGSTIVIDKSVLDGLLINLKDAGYQTIGSRVKNETLVYEEIERMDDLPRGYITEQEAGHFRLIHTGHSRYFDAIPGAQSWKQFLFPSRTELFKLQRSNHHWEKVSQETQPIKYAFIGVRACELNAIQIQDKVFMRADFTDEVYKSRRERVFILSVDCLHPADTCFCASMNTGPEVKGGFDLNLIELDNVFLVKIGSEVGRNMVTGLPFEPASAYLTNNAEHGLENAAQQMKRALKTDNLPEFVLSNLDNPRWQEIGARCLSCANCTQVCPTCFCWDVTDQVTLTGNETRRERVWDSCFNPGYSYQAGGNTRPSIESRYRQWLSHKLGSWQQQYGTLGCVGCGRCITWCPAKIDLVEEISIMREEAH
jgi:sulfhydrogenase subunit beta (sulfur reductase)